MIIEPNDSFSAARRLLVILPNMDFNLADLARRVAEITALENMTVVFVANTTDLQNEYRVRCRLATLAALMRGECARVETHFTLEQNWARVVESVYQRGDVVVCHGEQKSQSGVSLSKQLEQSLHAPVYVIAGLYPRNSNNKSSVTPPLFKIGVPVLIIGVFLAIQISIDRATAGLLHALLLSLSVVAEYGALVIWSIASPVM
jgi:hypothetical protein